MQAEDTAASEEALQICRHLDLECEVLPDGQLIVRRNELDFPEEGPPPGPAEVVTHSSTQMPAPPPQKRPRQGRAAAEAEHMLSVAPPGLSKFYAALQDAFPGYHGKLAKLMVAKLHAAGYSGPASSDSTSSSSETSSKKKKKKKKKQKKEKAKKKKEKDKTKSEDRAKADVDDAEDAKCVGSSTGAEVKVEPAEESENETGKKDQQTDELPEVKAPAMDPELEAELDAELALG